MQQNARKQYIGDEILNTDLLDDNLNIDLFGENL